MKPRILVAGIGNIFLGDDAFGVEVVRRLGQEPLPPEVRVVDFGIRGIHLAYDLMETRYDLTVLVDATPRGKQPGTVYLIEPDLSSLAPSAPGEAHGMSPEAVFGMLAALGGTPEKVLLVGCEPADVSESMGLSEPVAAAVEEATSLVLEILAQTVATDANKARCST